MSWLYFLPDVALCLSAWSIWSILIECLFAKFPTAGDELQLNVVSLVLSEPVRVSNQIEVILGWVRSS